MPNFDDFKLAIEAMTGGKNTVLFDDMGMPSVMVPFPKMKIAEIRVEEVRISIQHFQWAV